MSKTAAGIRLALATFFFFGLMEMNRGDGVEMGKEDFLQTFQNPPREFRPLQIIHGFDGILAPLYRHPLDKDFLAGLVQPAAPTQEGVPDLKQTLRKALQELKDLGLGGVVCNVSFRDYMRDEDQWTLFAWGLDACRELGLRVWIYDEEGYPSGAAGGLVLEKNPAYEAQELILDSSLPEGYRIRPSYEGTHASNNFHAARRYVNLLDRDADRTFIKVTHEAYAKICGSDFGKMIEAFFTDEPSLMACNLGQIPEEARKNVPVRDPLDPKVQRLPAVPWAHDLPSLFQQKYGYDITKKVRSLFAGDSIDDKKARRDYWALVSSLMAERYFGAIQEWSRPRGAAASGHILWEESLLYHPALNGNPLRNLQRMDIPGIDVLSSNPGNAFGGYALTAALAASAAKLNGTRRVMSETSDFSEQMAHRSASLEEMQATAAWQFALGVTDFTLYYGRSRAEDEYRRYCDYAGRLGALLTPAQRTVKVALYYPVHDLWTWYRPSADRLSLDSQPPQMKTIVQSFSDIVSQLTREGISFCLADHDHLAAASINGRQLSIDKAVFDAVILPAVDEIPAAAQKTLDAYRVAGGKIIDAANGAAWKDQAKPFAAADVTAESAGCLWSGFKRGEQNILLFVNTANQIWKGTVALPISDSLVRWDFAVGEAKPVSKDQFQEQRLKVELKPYESAAYMW